MAGGHLPHTGDQGMAWDRLRAGAGGRQQQDLASGALPPRPQLIGLHLLISQFANMRSRLARDLPGETHRHCSVFQSALKGYQAFIKPTAELGRAGD